jgi:hypothetical protein
MGNPLKGIVVGAQAELNAFRRRIALGKNAVFRQAERRQVMMGRARRSNLLKITILLWVSSRRDVHCCLANFLSSYQCACSNSVSDPQQRLALPALSSMLKGGFRSEDAVTPPQPILSREAFRLVVLLEAQKSTSVNVVALEQKFRVPPGYGEEDSDDRGRGRITQSVSQMERRVPPVEHALMHVTAGCPRSRDVRRS